MRISDWSSDVCSSDLNGRTTGNDREQIVPPAANATAMFFNEFAEGNAHGLFHNARPVHMPADLNELCALVIIAPQTGKPRRPTPENGGRDRDRFNIVDGGWTTIKTGACRKWRIQARLPLLTLKAFYHRGLLAADIMISSASCGERVCQNV